MAGAADTLIAIGKCGAPHGVRGQMRVKSYTGDPVALGSYGPLRLADGRCLAVAGLHVLKEDMLVVTFASVSSREAADALAGQELFVARSALPPAEAEEFYHADLIGLAARGADGGPLGHVIAILNFGAGDIIEIMPAGGGETLLLPFTRKVVPLVDIKAGYVSVMLPDEAEVPERGNQVRR